MRILLSALTAVMALAGPAAAWAAAPERVTIKGEIVDTWCYTSEIMYALGTSHHQCAVWCAVGGIPVSIVDEEENIFVVLRVEGDDTSVNNPRLLSIQTHEVTVEGDLYVRDGVNYLLIDMVADDHGIVNINHEDFGVQPQ